MNKSSHEWKPGGSHGSIKLLDSKGTVVLDWTLRHVMVSKWSITGFNAGQSAVAVEQMDLTHMGFLEDEKWPVRVLQLLIFPALIFTLRLKYAEFIILQGFCRWCAVSAVSITAFTVLIVMEWKRVQRLSAA